MILLLAILTILFEAITEGVLKRHGLAEFIFLWWVQWIIAIMLFAVWLLIVANFDNDIPLWKLITGFVFVRSLIFDPAWNLSRGVRWNYYGNTKLYDRVMASLASWGWFMKIILGIIGICFLLGWS